MKKKYKFKKSHGGPINTDDARKWIKRYKEKHPDGPWAFFYGEEIIKKILDQPGSVGMRIYFSENDEGKVQLVLVGADEDGQDILPQESSSAKSTLLKDSGGVAGDNGYPCPPYCS